MRLSYLSLFLVACGASQTVEPAPAPVAAPDPVPEVAEVSPIPDGMHTLNPSLVVDDVAAAIEFYKTALGAEHRYSLEGPDGSPVHAEILIGDTIVSLSPENADRHQASPKSLEGSNGSLHVYVEDADATFQAAIDAGATERMAVADMWWGDRYGEFLDPVGHRWTVATRTENVPAEVMKERAAAAMAAMGEGKEYTWEKGEAAPSYKPDGYWTVTPALTISGGADAVAFYEAALGAEVITSNPMPDGSLMHAELKVGDSMLMLSSEMPAEGPMAELAAYVKAPANLKGSPVQLMLYTDDATTAQAKAIEGGATERMAVADMYWGDRYGVVSDPSGTTWGIATHIEDVGPEDIKKRMMEAMAGADEAAEVEGEGEGEGEAAEEAGGEGDE